MNALDRLIGWAFPAAGLQRARARLVMDTLGTSKRRYDGAASGRRVNGWLAQGTSANTELETGLVLLRDRHRELVRNNPWARRAVEALVANTISYGFSAKLKTNKATEKKWKQWSDTTECDADGRHNLAGLEALAFRIMVESGEALVRRRWRQLSDGLSVPFQLQVLEPDYLDHGKTELLANGGRIVQGVEYSAWGKRTAYWLFKDHPGDMIGNTIESVPVPAAEILHLYRQERSPQSRGVPWGASVMLTLRDLDDYEDAYLLRQKLANCHVGAIIDSKDIPLDVAPAAGTAPLSENMEPGRYDLLPAGKDIKFNTPPNAGDYGPYTKAVLLRVAAGYGITFQALTGDLSSVNFSSGRMGWIEMGRNIEHWRWNIFVPQMLDGIAQWFREAANFGGPPADIGFTWTAPRREMINPAQEIAAYKEAVRNGFLALPSVHRELGEDSDAILAEYAETNKKLDQLDLVFDCDPRRVTAQGMTQNTNAAPEPASNSEE